MIQLTNAVDRYNKIILSELKENNINSWIAGGALRDYFSGVKINTDYDLFFPNESEYLKAVSYFKSKDCTVKWESENGMKIIYNKMTFDLVKKFFNTPKETIDAFDFTVSMFAVDSENVYYGDTSFIDLAKRQLMINKITYPASTMKRSFKYYKKGYSMCIGEMKKLVESIQDMPKPETQNSQQTTNQNTEPDNSSGDDFLFFAGID